MGGPVFPLLSPPSGAVADGDGSITLTWIHTSLPGDADITGYQFRLRAWYEDVWRPWRDIQPWIENIAGSNTASYNLEGLTPRVWYSVQLRVLYADGSRRPVLEVTAVPTEYTD